MSILVLKPGLQTTIQAAPRVGLRYLGVPASGAADPLSLALANKLVANSWDTPALESTLLGPTLGFETPCAFAITGAKAAVSLNGYPVAFHETVFAGAGDRLELGATETGARTYIAISGGVDADSILGSSSTYLAAGLGGLQGRALQEGDVLRVKPMSCDSLRTPDQFRVPMSSSWALRTCPSFETEQLRHQSRAEMFEQNWTIGRRADRIGMQLEGTTLDISSDGRMPSAAVFPGTVQCPENGTPYVLSVDAGTVGGYPRIAQVARVDRHLLGQLRPGDHIRFLRRDEQSARDELRAKLDYWRNWIDAIEHVI